MSLRQRRKVTPRMLAANRANAQKSTGPRTASGKARVALNGLKHGHYTGRLFRSQLVRAREDVGLYDWLYRQMCENIRPVGKAQWARAEELARWAWCHCHKAQEEGLRSGQKPSTSSSVWCLLRIPTSLGWSGPKPIYAVKSTDSRLTFPLRIRLEMPNTGIRLKFWVRSRRRVWPRVPLTELWDLPAHLVPGVVVKKAQQVDAGSSSSASTTGNKGNASCCTTPQQMVVS